MKSDTALEKKKQSFYFPTEMITEIRETADKHGISISQIVQRAWSVARETIKSYPGVDQ